MKGNEIKACCENHWGISNLSITGKVLVCVLLHRLSENVHQKNIIAETHCHFHAGHGIMETIFLWGRSKKSVESNTVTYKWSSLTSPWRLIQTAGEVCSSVCRKSGTLTIFKDCTVMSTLKASHRWWQHIQLLWDFQCGKTGHCSCILIIQHFLCHNADGCIQGVRSVHQCSISHQWQCAQSKMAPASHKGLFSCLTGDHS